MTAEVVAYFHNVSTRCFIFAGVSAAKLERRSADDDASESTRGGHCRRSTKGGGHLTTRSSTRRVVPRGPVRDCTALPATIAVHSQLARSQGGA